MKFISKRATLAAVDHLGRTRNRRGRGTASRRAREEPLEPRMMLAGGVYAQSLGTQVFWSEYPRGGFVDSSDKIVMTANMITGTSNDLQVAVFRATPNGNADTSFSGDGLTTTNASIGLPENPLDATEYTYPGYTGPKKYLVAGRDYNSLPVLMRYKEDGTLDATFGSQGIAKLSSGGGFADVLVQDDGKILVAGAKRVVRYTSTGTLDRTFGNKGIVDVPSVMRYSAAMALQTTVNGEKCVVVGGVGKNSSDPNDNFVVARYRLTNGSLDTTGFGTNGFVMTDLGYSDKLTDLEIVDNSVIAVGRAYGSDFGHPIMVSYGANGRSAEIKTTVEFGIDGGTLGCGADSAAIQAGKLVITGGVRGFLGGEPVDLFVARYNINADNDPAGKFTLDPSFGTGGVYVAKVGNFPILGQDDDDTGRLSVSIQSSGAIVVSGGAAIGDQDRFVFATRLTASGVLDTFGFGSANLAPVAVNDTVATNQNTSVTIPVLANDADPDVDDVLTLMPVTPTTNFGGTVMRTGDVLTYIPPTNFIGSDSFTYTIKDPSGLTDTATVAVTVKSPPRALSINDVTVTEGDRGTINAVFTVSLDGVNAVAVSFDYATSEGSAIGGVDFQQRSGRLTVPAGALTTTITIPVYGDRIAEVPAVETFTVNLSNPDGDATIADGAGIGTILDNDGGASSSGLSSAALATAARKKAARPTSAALAALSLPPVAAPRAVDGFFADFGSTTRENDRTGLAADLADIDFLFPRGR
jgi:uncharacterized delta-60 repeat protein